MDENRKEIDLILGYEPYLIGFFCITFVLRSLSIPFSSVLFVISASALAMIYVMKAYDRMDHITDPWVQYFRKSIVFLIAVGIIGILFHFQHWPYANQIKLGFLIGTPLFVAVSIVKNVQLKKVISPTEGLVILGLTLLIGATFLKLF